MVFGILESTRLENVPGTSLLEETDLAGNDSNVAVLKKGTGRHSHTVLVPQPSNDLNDPLHWPLWQRDLLLFLYLYCTVLCVGGIGPLLSASALTLVKQFNITFTQVTLLTGYQLCAVGALGVFISALSHKYGKRPGFIFSVTCAFVGTIWGGAANSYGSLVGARVVQGLSVSMFESVMFAVIGDMYYVHERGNRVAVLTIAISGLGNVPSLLSGVTTINLGWRWMFWMLAIFLGIALILVVLFGWETAYRRAAIFETDITSVDNVAIIGAMKEHKAHLEHVEHAPTDEKVSPKYPDTELTRSDSIDPLPRKSLVQRMAVFTGTYSDDNLLLMIARPFLILANPAVLWATLLLSITTAWFVVISFVIAEIFSSPPYLLDAAQIGYMSAGPVVGGTLGSIAAGAMSDPICTYLAKKNKGVYEPEFRLILLLPYLVLVTLGFFLFGNLVEEGASPAGIAAVWGVATASAQFIFVVTGTYMIDAYRSISVEVFIIGMIVKNFLFFGLSFGVNDWVTSWGPARVFNTIGGIQVALFFLSIPIWVLGKKARALSHAKHIS